ncbi:MAG TPA: FAD:protein FMN transferase [Gemmatimonadota bacterium]|nr:FAD:protein FMN transferase [Gemmatimonadota bacterium]
MGWRTRCGSPVALAVGAVIVACATAERAPAEDPAVAIAVDEAREELAGVVLTRRHFSLGSQVSATVAAPDSATAEAALTAAFAVMDSVETLTSLYVPASEINAVNEAAGREPVVVSPWTETILAAVLEWAERSEGAFDPTVGPMVELWGFGRATVEAPSPASLAEVRRRVGWRKVRLDPAAHTVFLTEPGMVLDLRAATKGFALDRGREAMQAAGVTSGIADIGGDIIFFGPGTETSSDLWTISLPDPYDPGSTYARFELPPGAVSTSAALDRAIVIGGERYGHLIDPRTGWPVQGLASVSAYAPDAMTSDMAATALYILGPRDGPQLIEEWTGVEAVFVTEAEPRTRSVVIVTTGIERYRRELEPPYRPIAPEDE